MIEATYDATRTAFVPREVCEEITRSAANHPRKDDKIAHDIVVALSKTAKVFGGHILNDTLRPHDGGWMVDFQ